MQDFFHQQHLKFHLKCPSCLMIRTFPGYIGFGFVSHLVSPLFNADSFRQDTKKHAFTGRPVLETCRQLKGIGWNVGTLINLDKIKQKQTVEGLNDSKCGVDLQKTSNLTFACRHREGLRCSVYSIRKGSERNISIVQPCMHVFVYHMHECMHVRRHAGILVGR